MRGDRDHASLTLVHQAMEIFQLLPTSPMHRWLIAADWLEEAGAEVAAAAIREGIAPGDNPNNPDYLYSKTDGYGDRTGYGEGYGDGMGDGDGTGEGYRDMETIYGPYEGHGYGNGRGRGYCFGEKYHTPSYRQDTGATGCYEGTIIRFHLRQQRRIF